MQVLLETSGAQTATLIIHLTDHWMVEASIAPGSGVEFPMLALENYTSLPLSLITYVERTKEIVLLNDATNEPPFNHDPYIVNVQPKSIVCVPVTLHNKIIAIVYLENNATTFAFSHRHVKMLELLAGQAAISLENARFFAADKRFVPFEFLLQLNKSNLADVRLGDQVEKQFSILFGDIRGYTILSEKLSPAETFEFINYFLGFVEPFITANHGFIDKFIGDAIMALFSEGTDLALKSAIAIQENLRNNVNARRLSHQQKPIAFGMGINTGDLTLGVVGSEHRLQSSVIGDAVNIAAHTERLTRVYNVPLLITREAKNSLQNPAGFQLRYVDAAYVKGKANAIEVWEVCNGYAEEVRLLKLKTLASYNQAIRLCKEQNFIAAKKIFEECLRQNPLDRVVQFYIRRCEESQKNNGKNHKS